MNPSAVCGYVNLISSDLENEVTRGTTVIGETITFLAAKYDGYFSYPADVDYWLGTATIAWLRLSDRGRAEVVSQTMEERFLTLCFTPPTYANDLFLRHLEESRGSWMEIFSCIAGFSSRQLV